ncbi:MAG TPA: hypothetical protein VJI66_02275 [Candidatus Paceibacterota bacterium]
MKWANFLHIYQPADQQRDILEAIVVQSYRPIISHLIKTPNIRLTMNITGALLELLDKNGYTDIIDMLRTLGEDGKVEFTGSAKYHAFLPFVEEDDMIRQIKVNNETNLFYLGKGYKPKGFFPPEMGYGRNIVPIVESLGFEWILLDEIALNGNPGNVDYTKIYKIKDSNMRVFFRERRLSNLIMSAVVRSPETLYRAMKDDIKSDRYVVTAMDGETFGHHRPGLEKLLFNIFETKDFDLVTVSDLLKYYHDEVEIDPTPSTWASSKEDIDRNVQFLSWKDPENRIHRWQWELFNLARTHVKAMNPSHPRYKEVMHRMDISTASDHFWWASAKPWWSLEMIEDGAYRLLDTLRMVPDAPELALTLARDLYEKIISTAFNWQRTGKIRQMMSEQKSITRIPFADRTLGRGDGEEGVYHAFMDMMKKLEKEATKNGEYEKAILWRDAMYKLENKLDIYDTINAIDLLRVEIPHDEVEATIEKYKAKYRAIRGGQPEQRGS